MRNLSTKNRERLVNKFIEVDYAKTDRLLEMHFKYMDRMDEGMVNLRNIKFEPHINKVELIAQVIFHASFAYKPS